MFRSVVVIGFAVAALPGAAVANSASATMEVTLVVEPSCRVSATPLAFAGQAGQPMDAASQIAIACNDETPVVVRLDAGLNGDAGARRLSGEGGQVEYTVYADPAHSLEWTAGNPMSGTASAVPLTLAAYGRIDAEATLAAMGVYRDSLTITVDF